MTDTNQIQKTLLDELGLADLPQDKKEQLVIKMTEVILKRIFLETMERLDDEGKDQYEKLVKGNATPDQMEEFLKSKIGDYDEVIQKIVDDFKKEMVSEK